LRTKGLARSHRDIDTLRDLDRRMNVVMGNRVLKPRRKSCFQALTNSDGRIHAEARVRLDGQVHLAPNGFTDGIHDIDRQLLINPRHLPPCRPEGIKLERRVSESLGAFGAFSKRLRSARATIPAVGINPDFIVTPAT